MTAIGPVDVDAVPLSAREPEPQYAKVMISRARFRRSLFAVVPLVLAAACAPPPHSLPAPGSGGVAPDPSAPASAIATQVLTGCRGSSACVERTLVALIPPAGIGRTMEVLDTLASRDGEVQSNAHALAHGLGIAAYTTPAAVAATLAECPTSQMSGCLHGVIQGYFLDLTADGGRVGQAELEELCQPHRERQFVFFQCAHGMGHGLMTLFANHLPTALESCDQIRDEFTRDSCYGGAFMENIMNVTHHHQTASGHAHTQGAPQDAHAGGGDEHAGHDMPATEEWRGLDPEDPLFPCNAVSERYGNACYWMQTSAILFYNRGNVEETTRACESAPELFQSRCFMSLGRDLTAWAAQDHRRTVDLCSRTGSAASGQGRVWCERGAVETLINQSANPDDGIRFCGVVADARGKTACYEAVGRFMLGLVADAAGRERHCAGAEQAYVAICRRGAEVEADQSRSEAAGAS